MNFKKTLRISMLAIGAIATTNHVFAMTIPPKKAMTTSEYDKRADYANEKSFQGYYAQLLQTAILTNKNFFKKDKDGNGTSAQDLKKSLETCRDEFGIVRTNFPNLCVYRDAHKDQILTLNLESDSVTGNLFWFTKDGANMSKSSAGKYLFAMGLEASWLLHKKLLCGENKITSLQGLFDVIATTQVIVTHKTFSTELEKNLKAKKDLIIKKVLFPYFNKLNKEYLKVKNTKK